MYDTNVWVFQGFYFQCLRAMLYQEHCAQPIQTSKTCSWTIWNISFMSLAKLKKSSFYCTVNPS